VREAVFSMLADWAGAAGGPAESQLSGLSVLDLFAGSGAVAVEAMSRGAAKAVAVDSASAAVAAIRANASTTGLGVEAARASVAEFLKNGSHPVFDIVWLDPPYDLPSETMNGVLCLVTGWLAPGGIVAVERSGRGEPPIWPAGLASWGFRRYGETVVYFAQEAT